MKKVLLSIAVVIVGSLLMIAPVFADEAAEPEDRCPNGIKTAILGENGCYEKEDNNGQGVIDILNLVVNIMTIGIGILGVIGITIVGIQYLTAGGNEAMTRKAKTRLFEIIIGLVAYVLIYALLKWLMPFDGS